MQLESILRSGLVKVTPEFAPESTGDALRLAADDAEHNCPSPSMDSFLKSVRLGRVEGY
ncbi:MAG TPA: hypothetical protein VNZ26_34365 [Vicinamibacterales bacterium]|nr:hypothetical protein [Vicinamibacterales bacterium]